MINQSSEVYTVKDIQELLKISKNAAYNLVKSQVFPVVKLGDTYRVSKVVFNNWLHNQTK